MCACVCACTLTCVRSCQLPSIESADRLISLPDAKLVVLGGEVHLGVLIGKSPGHSVARSYIREYLTCDII